MAHAADGIGTRAAKKPVVTRLRRESSVNSLAV